MKAYTYISPGKFEFVNCLHSPLVGKYLCWQMDEI